jgi:4a-hydroxytetrahydrobiopterin dehydratase
MASLAEENAVPVAAGAKPLSRAEAEKLARDVSGWRLKGDAIERELKFKDFAEAIDFVNAVARVAQKQDHHPDICISYNKVRLEFSTHRIGGLSRNDFVLAAKVDRLA